MAKCNIYLLVRAWSVIHLQYAVIIHAFTVCLHNPSHYYETVNTLQQSLAGMDYNSHTSKYSSEPQWMHVSPQNGRLFQAKQAQHMMGFVNIPMQNAHLAPPTWLRPLSLKQDMAAWGKVRHALQL